MPNLAAVSDVLFVEAEALNALKQWWSAGKYVVHANTMPGVMLVSVHITPQHGQSIPPDDLIRAHLKAKLAGLVPLHLKLHVLVVMPVASDALPVNVEHLVRVTAMSWLYTKGQKQPWVDSVSVVGDIVHVACTFDTDTLLTHAEKLRKDVGITLFQTVLNYKLPFKGVKVKLLGFFNTTYCPPSYLDDAMAAPYELPPAKPYFTSGTVKGEFKSATLNMQTLPKAPLPKFVSALSVEDTQGLKTEIMHCVDADPVLSKFLSKHVAHIELSGATPSFNVVLMMKHVLLESQPVNDACLTIKEWLTHAAPSMAILVVHQLLPQPASPNGMLTAGIQKNDSHVGQSADMHALTVALATGSVRAVLGEQLKGVKPAKLDAVAKAIAEKLYPAKQSAGYSEAALNKSFAEKMNEQLKAPFSTKVYVGKNPVLTMKSALTDEAVAKVKKGFAEMIAAGETKPLIMSTPHSPHKTLFEHFVTVPFPKKG